MGVVDEITISSCSPDRVSLLFAGHDPGFNPRNAAPAPGFRQAWRWARCFLEPEPGAYRHVHRFEQLSAALVFPV